MKKKWETLDITGKVCFIGLLVFLLFLGVCIGSLPVSADNDDNLFITTIQDEIEPPKLYTDIYNFGDPNTHRSRLGAKLESNMQYNESNGHIVTVDPISSMSVVEVREYDTNYNIVNHKRLEYELPIYGGTHIGKYYNYILFGQENLDEDDNLEVIRLVKYDKEFNRLGSIPVKDCFTIEPFRFSSARLCESDLYPNKLLLHTSRLRYTSEDGNNHQSNLTVMFDIDKMEVANDILVSEFQTDQVSHSFDQYILYDSEYPVVLDLGDGHPRGIVMNTFKPGEVYDYMREKTSYSLKATQHMLFEIPGEIGRNATGVKLGSFVKTEHGYLVSFDTIKHSEDYKYSDCSIEGLEYNDRDVVLLYVRDDAIDSDSNDGTLKDFIDLTYFTNYAETNKHDKSNITQDRSAGMHYLVDLHNNTYLLMWEEYSRIDTILEYGKDWDLLRYDCMKYVIVDELGNKLTDVQESNEARLSRFNPIFVNNSVYWCVDELYQTDPENPFRQSSLRHFYKLDISELEISNRMIFTIDKNIATIFGKSIEYDVSPIILNNRTMMPARYVAENLGAEVYWDSNTRQVKIIGINEHNQPIEILLTIDSSAAYVNNNLVELDSPATIIDNRTYTPSRFIAEYLGAKVDWFESEKQVIISK